MLGTTLNNSLDKKIKDREELKRMYTEYQNDELLQTLYNTAVAFKIEIKDPFSTDISYNDFLTEFKIKMNNRAKQYLEMTETN